MHIIYAATYILSSLITSLYTIDRESEREIVYVFFHYTPFFAFVGWGHCGSDSLADYTRLWLFVHRKTRCLSDRMYGQCQPITPAQRRAHLIFSPFCLISSIQSFRCWSKDRREA